MVRGAGRLRVCEGSAHADAARVVHAPNGQLPAYEWAFGDVNPPVHAWAAWRVYKIEKKRRGVGDRQFLERVFKKLLSTHVVGQPQGRVGQQRLEGGFLAWTTSACSTARSRCDRRQAAAVRCDSWMASTRSPSGDGDGVTRHDNPAYEDLASKFGSTSFYTGTRWAIRARTRDSTSGTMRTGSSTTAAVRRRDAVSSEGPLDGRADSAFCR